jgi:hypothetical protein
LKLPFLSPEGRLSPVHIPACDISAGLGQQAIGTAHRCGSWRHIGERPELLGLAAIELLSL